MVRKNVCSLTNKPERALRVGRGAPTEPQRDRAGGPREARTGARRHGTNGGRSQHRASLSRGQGCRGPGEKASGRQRGGGRGRLRGPGGPGLHDAAPGPVRVRLLEPQPLPGPVFLQVGELLAVDGSAPLPGGDGTGRGRGSVRRRPSSQDGLHPRSFPPPPVASAAGPLLQAPPRRPPSPGPLVSRVPPHPRATGWDLGISAAQEGGRRGDSGDR